MGGLTHQRTHRSQTNKGGLTHITNTGTDFDAHMGRLIPLETRIAKLTRQLYRNKEALFQKQHRDAKKKTFSLAGSFKVGVGSTQVGNKQHVSKGKKGFIMHPFKNTAVFLTLVDDQKLSKTQKSIHRKSMRIIKKVDPEYAAGETIVQVACMSSPEHKVGRHVDREDISHQYAMSLGKYTGAVLRAYDANGVAHDLDNHEKIAKFDGRLPHEVVMDEFRGVRFTVIWYKNYDHRKTEADPILQVPSIVWSP
jgi:hypothetical protein